MIPMLEREKTVHVLDRADTIFGTYQTILCHNPEDHDMIFSAMTTPILTEP
jgi:hypothetical protein